MSNLEMLQTMDKDEFFETLRELTGLTGIYAAIFKSWLSSDVDEYFFESPQQRDQFIKEYDDALNFAKVTIMTQINPENKSPVNEPLNIESKTAESKNNNFDNMILTYESKLKTYETEINRLKEILTKVLKNL